MQWNVLVLDDDQDIAENVAELISGNKVLQQPDTIFCTKVASFDEAINLIQINRFDLMILDLKDDQADGTAHGDEEFSGERVLKELRKVRFTPVVFHSGYAYKVDELKSPFVRVVAKGDSELLRTEVAAIFDTRLPKLVRYIEEQQRAFLWDHIENDWNDGQKICEDNELAYLVARRLGNALSSSSIRFFMDPGSPDRLVRPVELYIWPPIPEQIVFGDILQSLASHNYQIVLTPSCDCVNAKAERALVAECVNASALDEYSAVVAEKAKGVEVSKTKRNELLAMVRDRRSVKGLQPERFKFLPATKFLPDLVVDLQELSRVDFADLLDAEKYRRVATLDSPFAEALQNRFTQYYGRVGTPDLHAEMVVARILE